MEDKFYTINQVSEKLDLHHKTIRNFINMGKLKASKIGKQWRISEEDLNSFMGINKNPAGEEVIEFSTSGAQAVSIDRRVRVSTVVDIEAVCKEEYIYISNTLIAIMNGKDEKMQHSTINMKYYEKECRLKVLLWGGLQFIDRKSTRLNSSHL